MLYAGNTKRKGSDLITTMTIVDLLREIDQGKKRNAVGRRQGVSGAGNSVSRVREAGRRRVCSLCS